MPANTVFKPVHRADFTADKLNFNGIGILANAAGATTTNIDYTLVDDNLLQGVQMYSKTSTFGDSVTLQVIDTATGTYSGTPNALLNQFATNWRMRDDQQLQLDKELEYPAKLQVGMIVRAQYTAKGLTTVQVALNYDFHKVMI